jgi:hypothetical protein
MGVLGGCLKRCGRTPKIIDVFGRHSLHGGEDTYIWIVTPKGVGHQLHLRIEALICRKSTLYNEKTCGNLARILAEERAN